MRLESLTRPELIFPDLPAADRDSVLRAFAVRLADQKAVRDAEELYQKLAERERLGSTGIGAGVAIPHCKLKGLSQALLAVGVVGEGVDFGAVDGRPVRVFFLIVSPLHAPAEHLQVLAAISKWIRSDRRADTILGLDDARAIYDLLKGGQP